ncbi:NADH-FMN oxidoreductase RutF, flavin reductase (DIM6/NTAB) family [Sinosporangium album]|uniref:NADH-FMN oxidoreductase RutF, flavin reductase (DIM6/NTAB) family n=1 Tax=Sinosporangium album TaxID=504805 RepID=A0A1G7Y3F2_9ACTN|nr:flavin reductase family protein [Sinosporangium album]SDG90867.1 NADH-FMN oxidoreductase RutF, flavin reductase (DIM6/NTAB) family [Sinosporangium album]
MRSPDQFQPSTWSHDQPMEWMLWPPPTVTSALVEQQLAQDAYRRIVGRFATGITVITTHYDGIDHAMTVNSFASVSLDPLLTLFCADRRSRFHDTVLAAGVWGVSVLGDTMEDASRAFARSGRDLEGQLDGFPHHRGALGVALLDGAIATLECRTTAVHDGGDHSIVIGAVVAMEAPSDASPLLYHEGRYRRL